MTSDNPGGTFALALAFTISVEKAFQKDPGDPGNWTGGKVGVGVLKGTCYGISAASYPDEDIANMTPARAAELYRRDYWAKIAGDNLPPAVALMAFDTAVNHGQGVAAMMLQRAVGAASDGKIGPITLGRVRTQPPKAVLLELAARRIVAYAQDPKFDRDGLGWSRRLMACLTTAEALL